MKDFEQGKGWDTGSSEDPSGVNWRTDWRPGGQEEAWVGTPGRVKRIQRKKLKKVGRAPRFLSSLEAI